jgi:hypothetical protein
MARVTIASNDFPSAGIRALGSGGGSEKCAHSFPSSVGTVNGTLPVSTCVIMQPSE